MRAVATSTLRARFAEVLASLYGREVPAYTDLVDACLQVNARVVHRAGDHAERMGGIDRITAERHGAIRVGSPAELGQVARVFGALGMEATGFYDLRDARPRPIPVVSTAFRPVDREELAANPFRVFTSMLVTDDRRFFDRDLQSRVERFVARRVLFPGELLALADRARDHGGLDPAGADRFLELTAAAFTLSADPVDRAWHEELAAVSDVAADIAGLTSTHINHLTPRVLDIDDLYRTMTARGVRMIDRIQGPPRWGGPDVLLRQTSLRALAEPRRFLEANGEISEGTLSVRFGEVEQRGIALTTAGRDLYDRAMAEVDRLGPQTREHDRATIAAEAWARHFPTTEHELWSRGLGHFTYHAEGAVGARPDADLSQLIRGGVVQLQPIVYEDFLPRSAAGIFASNLFGGSQVGHDSVVDGRDIHWLADVVGGLVHEPEDLYAAESGESLRRLESELGRDLSPPRAVGHDPDPPRSGRPRGDARPRPPTGTDHGPEAPDHRSPRLGDPRSEPNLSEQNGADR